MLKTIDAQGYPRTDAWITGAGEAPPENRAPAAGHRGARHRAPSGPRRNWHEPQRKRAGAALRGARRHLRCGVRGCRRAPGTGERAGGDVCGEPQHQLHQRLLLPLPVLRLLQGQDERESARPALRPATGGDRAAGTRGVGTRRDRGLPPGRHPSRLHRRDLSLPICRAIKAAEPAIHVHAFSPLEIWQGAATLGRTVPDFLAELQEAGLGSLPGTAAEILDDEVRAVICPDKIATDQWLSVMEAAHGLGLRSTATIMFGHVDSPRHWARHLLRVRALQERTGGFNRIRAASLRRDGGAALSQRPRSARADLARSCAHARGGEARAQPGHRQHPDLVGQDGAGGRCGLPPRGRQRYRRYADERIDHPRRWREPRAGVSARGDRGASRGAGAHAGATHDALSARAHRAPGRCAGARHRSPRW